MTQKTLDHLAPFPAAFDNAAKRALSLRTSVRLSNLVPDRPSAGDRSGMERGSKARS